MSEINVSRKEDMSPRGQLQVMLDNEGDIHVAVYEDDGNGKIVKMASVEFTTCGSGGGKSPKTRMALIDLMKAIQEDNKCEPFRTGDIPGTNEA